jgi:hypothetical protein
LEGKTVTTNVGKTTHQPKVQYRVLATDWEAETFTECWTESLASAQTIAVALKVRDVSVQIDKVCGASEAIS